MDKNQNKLLDQLLEEIAESLDIPESYYQKAEQRYHSVGTWLGQADSPLASKSPEIYPQGSFRLGTIVKPINGNDEYDIDLVCVLKLDKSLVTQYELKQMVGDRLKANKTYCEMLDEEGRRCWTLNYTDDVNFHMDILPGISDSEFGAFMEVSGVPSRFASQAIAMTDKTHPQFRYRTREWPCSNPKGYAEWFKNRMLIQFDERRIAIATARKSKIEQIPDYQVKTPLQRAIQILKRHRDIMFEHDSDNAPISIIITTLAAHAYNNETSVLDTLINIIEKMPSFIQNKNGTSYVGNPVNPKENFADKWCENHLLEKNFRAWIVRVKEDISNITNQTEIVSVGKKLTSCLGSRVTDKAIAKFSDNKITKESFNVTHREKIQWPLALEGEVEIFGQYKIDRDWLDFRSDSTPIPKHCELIFRARIKGIEGSFDVFWQVVNTGDEATLANQLRGQILPSKTAGVGGLIQKESTSYTGSHWVECFIVKGNNCVAHSGEYVVNIL